MEPTNIYDVLEKEQFVTKFRAYLKRRLALENLLFYESAVQFKGLTQEQELRTKGEEIINTFIIVDSDNSLNIPYHMRNSLLALEDYDVSAFDEAKVEVVNLMNLNFFIAFKNFLKDPSKEDSFAALFGDEGEGNESTGDINSYNKANSNLIKKTSIVFKCGNCRCKRVDPEFFQKMMNERLFCCEMERAKVKFMKIRARFERSSIRKKIKRSGTDFLNVFKRRRFKVKVKKSSNLFNSSMNAVIPQEEPVVSST